MNKTTTQETRTVVRHPAHLIITGYSIQAADPYGKESRETLEVVGDGDQIISAIVDWLAMRHRDAQGGSQYAKQDLERLAGAMGLSYGVKTEEA